VLLVLFLPPPALELRPTPSRAPPPHPAGCGCWIAASGGGAAMWGELGRWSAQGS